MNRKPIFAANWKMNKGASETEDFVKSFLSKLQGQDFPCEIVIAPPFVSLAKAAEILGNVSSIALAAQNAGQQVLGYTSQARFLINCGLVDLASVASVADRAQAMKLVHEHEMGELFKVLVLAPPASAEDWQPLGLSSGDRSHRL